MTPLYDVLKDYAQKKPARFHMPGHKGVFLPIPELMAAAALLLLWWGLGIAWNSFGLLSL